MVGHSRWVDPCSQGGPSAAPLGLATTCSFPMPLDPTFAGYVLQHQVLQLEVFGGGAATGLAGSNGLALTIGVL